MKLDYDITGLGKHAEGSFASLESHVQNYMAL